MKNGRDYLLDFAKDNSNWIKALIIEAIETNGCISEEKKEDILESFIYEKNIDIGDCSSNFVASSDTVRLRSLTHKEGVNALENNETIKFCDDLNILFGLNGTGKSSYFRILNEIVGGNQKKEILPNINSKEPAKVRVDISYKCNDDLIKIEEWDANSRSLSKINNSMVYDTSYQNGLLDIRKTNTTLVEPLGLNLFGYVINIIDDMKKKINEKIDDLEKCRPYILSDDFNEEIKVVFTEGRYSEEDKKRIKAKFDFKELDEKTIEETQESIKYLKQTNLKDKIKLLNNEYESIESLIKEITKVPIALKKYLKEANDLISTYEIKKRNFEKEQKKYKVLEGLSQSNPEEWENFIEAGEKYIGKLKSKNENICPYCLQELRTDKSIEIVKGYSLYLKNSSKLELDEINNNISELTKEILDMKVEISYQENIIETLKTYRINDKSLFEEIKKISNVYIKVKEKILDSLNTYSFVKIELEDSLNILEKLKIISKETTEKIKIYSKEADEKNDKLEELEIINKKLQEKKSISMQKEKIDEWFELSEEINRLIKKEVKINSRSLSLASKKAHKLLLTESLREKFNEELNYIGLYNLEVELKSEGISKGISSTKLVIKDLDDVKMVLSEGEQKAIALSLFIAETRLQNDLNPIIMDDPVNSLDHKIAGKFAERLMELDNQIIIFTHNRLFLDSFETTKNNHVCKTIDSDCNKKSGKHIRIYEVISHGRNSKGVLRQYKGKKLKNRISEIELALNKKPFEDDIKVATMIRLSVEATIDEVVFNCQVPTKYSNKNSRINWNALKELNTDNELIDKLQKIHSRVSGGTIHDGTEQNQNPPELEDYKAMVDEIKSFL